jgi:hypothetical protein
MLLDKRKPAVDGIEPYPMGLLHLAERFEIGLADAGIYMARRQRIP